MNGNTLSKEKNQIKANTVSDVEQWSEVLTSILLPAFNEELALPRVLEDLLSFIDNNYEIIVIDDGSTDKTAEVARNYNCRLLQHEINKGKGVAVQTGLKNSRGKYVVVMDADATYPVSAILEIVNQLKTQDMVRCIRQGTNESMPQINRIGNKLFDWFLTGVLGLKGGDFLSGLYGLRRSVFEEMNLEANGFDLETEINIKAQTKKIRVVTHPIVYLPRLGEKKLHPFRDGWRILNRILLLILVYNPTRFFIIPGLFVLALGIIGASILRKNALITPYFGLDVHSFILATLGILGGFQLVVFGVTASLYAIEAGYEPRKWLVRLSSAPIRLGAAGIGILLAFYELIHILKLIIIWFQEGAGAFYKTQELVLAASILVGGLQLLSASLFISIFASRLQRASTAKK